MTKKQNLIKVGDLVEPDNDDRPWTWSKEYVGELAITTEITASGITVYWQVHKDFSYDQRDEHYKKVEQ